VSVGSWSWTNPGSALAAAAPAGTHTGPAPAGWHDWFHIPSYIGTFWGLVQDQLTMALTSVFLGLLIALGVGLLCVRWKKVYPPVLAVVTIIYSVPSLALFMLLLPFTGLTQTTVIIPLTFYSLSALIPNVYDGLAGVPEDVRLAAVAMGFSGPRRLLTVDLPLAVPPIMAGVRVATVSNISMVSIGALISQGAFGELFTDAAQLGRTDYAWKGIITIVVMALAIDLLLVLIQKLLTPWNKRRTA
jgi:osmoprotectant transport system permease protein